MIATFGLNEGRHYGLCACARDAVTVVTMMSFLDSGSSSNIEQ